MSDYKNTYCRCTFEEVAHYRDADKLECDVLIKEGVESLTALKNKLDTTKMKKPAPGQVSANIQCSLAADSRDDNVLYDLNGNKIE